MTDGRASRQSKWLLAVIASAFACVACAGEGESEYTVEEVRRAFAREGVPLEPEPRGQGVVGLVSADIESRGEVLVLVFDEVADARARESETKRFAPPRVTWMRTANVLLIIPDHLFPVSEARIRASQRAMEAIPDA